MNDHERQWDEQHSDSQADTERLDFVALRADDQFLDALSRDAPVLTGDDDEYRLAVLLSGWRRDSLSAPPPPLPSVDEVEHAIAASGQPRRGRRTMRHLRVVSGAAAVAVVAAAGLIVVAEGAQPGDALWGVKSVVFAEQAQQTKAMVEAKNNLEQAQSAVQTGDLSSASSLISKASESLKPVKDEETRRRMNEWIERIKDDSADKATGASSSRSSPKRSSTTSADEDAATDNPGTDDSMDPTGDDGGPITVTTRPSDTVVLDAPTSRPPSTSNPPETTVAPTATNDEVTTAAPTAADDPTDDPADDRTAVETTSPSN